MSTQFTNRQWRLPNEENKSKVSNYSMSFDGSSEMINVSEKFDFVQQTGIFSVSCWIKLDNYTSTDLQEILNTNNIGRVQDGWRLFYDNRGISGSYNNKVIGFYLYGDNGTSSGANLDLVYKDNAILDNDWHHIAVTGSSAGTYGTLTLYIDGTAVATRALLSNSLTTDTANNDLRIGDYNSNYNFDGIIDQVAIFDYALTDGTGGTTNQIAELYGSLTTGVGNPMAITNGRKPVFYAPLGDQDAFNGANYLVPNSSLKDYVFDFSSDYIEVPNSSDFDFGTGDFTISAWVNTTGTTTQHRTVVSKQNPSTSGQWSFQVLTDGRVNFYGNNGGIDVLSTTTINDGNWHNIIIQRTGNIFNLYIDKVLAAQSTASGQNITNTQVLRIGRRLTAYNAYFDGQMSNVQIFNSALPTTGSNSVETLYNNGSPLTSMTGFSSLVSWYKLNASDTYDSSTGNWTIEDHAGSNDGTSSGMTQANLVQSDLSFTSGYSPYALDFDGTDDSINLGNVLNQSGDNAFSISAWVYIKSSSTSMILGKQETSGNFTGYAFQLINSKFRFALYESSTASVVIDTNNSLNTNQWYHLTGTYNGLKTSSGVKLYINGSEENTTSVGQGSFSNISNTADFSIGSRANSQIFFNGSLSNVSYWNTALTQAQVSEIYNEGVPSNLNNHSAYSNLVSWWQLGSNTSWVDPYWIALDEKGTNNGESQNVAAPNNMGENAIVDGVGSYANGLSSGMGGDEVIGDAPYSSSNSLSVNMDVEDRTTDTPS